MEDTEGNWNLDPADITAKTCLVPEKADYDALVLLSDSDKQRLKLLLSKIICLQHN